MKVLFCSPYKVRPEVIGAGIKIWADNILQYYKTIKSDIEIVPASFDRRYYISVDTNKLKRLLLGYKEYKGFIVNAIKLMDTKQCDAMHVCSSASFSLIKDYILVKAARKRGVKSAVHFHFGRIPELSIKNNWEWKLLKRVIKLADCIITMDNASYTTLCDLGYNNIKYCPNPLSDAIMKQIDSEFGTIKREKNKLLFVGHVLPSKGVFELIDACSRFDNMELHIIGKAQEPVYSQLLKQSKRKDNGLWLKMRGEMPHEEVLREMQSATLFTFPSYTEGFPGVILEAMACGCPIVTTKVGAIPEMLDINGKKKYGICVNPRNADEFADGIKVMLDNPTFALECAKNAKQRVYEHYAVPVVWEQLSSIWKTI